MSRIIFLILGQSSYWWFAKPSSWGLFLIPPGWGASIKLVGYKFNLTFIRCMCIIKIIIYLFKPIQKIFHFKFSIKLGKVNFESEHVIVLWLSWSESPVLDLKLFFIKVFRVIIIIPMISEIMWRMRVHKRGHAWVRIIISGIIGGFLKMERILRGWYEVSPYCRVGCPFCVKSICLGSSWCGTFTSGCLGWRGSRPNPDNAWRMDAKEVWMDCKEESTLSRRPSCVWIMCSRLRTTNWSAASPVLLSSAVLFLSLGTTILSGEGGERALIPLDEDRE